MVLPKTDGANRTLHLVHVSKYKLMETNMERAKQNMKDKVPEIERSLDLVRHLQERQVR